MLVLSRNRGEEIRIGNNITVRVLESCGNRVRIGIDAPAECRILRGELVGRPEPTADSVVERPRRGILVGCD